MQKYFICHSFPKDTLTEEQICQVSEASQKESQIKGYRSFFNLTEGKAWCVMEADSPQAIAAWFKKMEIPYDSIERVEMEGERGKVNDLRPQTAGA